MTMSFSQRNCLWVMLFTGVIVYTFNYSCLNIAITAMVKSNSSLQNESHSFACCEHEGNISSSNETEPLLTTGEYDWDPVKENLLMGSFSWFIALAQLAGALLCQKYGGKNVYFFSNLFLGILSCLMPWGASMGLEMLIVLRCLLGIAGGCGNGVAVKTLIAKWVPPDERTKFVSVMTGLYGGSFLSFYINSWIMHFIGWRAVFYTAGALSFVWCTLWIHFIYENPKDDPRITLSELSFIQQSIGISLSQKRLPIPWTQIFSSRPVRANTFTSLGITYFIYTLSNYMPTYFREIHGFSSREINYFFSIPYFLEPVFTIGFAISTDQILQLQMMKVTKMRKAAMLFSTLVSGILVSCLINGGCNRIVILFFFTAAITIIGISLAVISANIIDMSPNFCAVIHGLQSVFCQAMGFVSAIIVAGLTDNEKSVEQWNKVFLINGAVIISAGLLFSFMGDSTVQPWNYEHGYSERARRNEQLLSDGTVKKNSIVIVHNTRRT